MITMYARMQKKTQMYKTVFWTLGDGEGGMISENGTDTCIITQVNELPVQVQCMIQDTWGWCTGITRRDGMRREMAGDSGWGTHVHLWQIHIYVLQNQYNIVKQLDSNENKYIYIENKK